MTFVEEEEVILGQEDDIDVNTPAPDTTFAISLSELGVDLRTPTMDTVSQPSFSIRTEHGTSVPLTNAVANDHTAQRVTSSAAAPNTETMSSSTTRADHDDEKTEASTTNVQQVTSSAAAPNTETMSSSTTRADHDDEKTEANTTNVQQSTTFTCTTSVSTTSTRHVQTLSGPSIGTPEVGCPGQNNNELGMQGTRLKHSDTMADRTGVGTSVHEGATKAKEQKWHSSNTGVGTSVHEGATKAKEQKQQSLNKPQKEMRVCKCGRQSAASCFCGYTNLCQFCQEPCPICEFKAPKPLPPHT